MEQLIYEKSKAGRRAEILPKAQVPQKDLKSLIPANLLRSSLPALPEVSELDAVRHFVKLSHLNHCIDTGFYPLGSCTMKYNPKVNDAMAALDGFRDGLPALRDVPLQHHVAPATAAVRAATSHERT